MENKHLFAKNSILYLIAMIIPKVAGFIVLPIYTRHIVPEEYGIYSLTTSMMGVMAVLSSMGLNAFYLRNYAVAEDKKELNGTIFWSMAVWNTFLFLLSLLVMPFVLKLVKAPFSFYPYMLLALVTQLFNSMEIIPMRTYRIRGEVKYYLIRIATKTFLNVAFGLTFVVGLQLGVLGKYYSELITTFIFAVIFILYMKRNSYLRINKALLRKALKFSLPIVPSDLVQMSSPMLINMIIEKVLSLAQLGVYSIGVTISGVIHLITTSIYLTVEPVLYTRAASEDYPQFFKKLKDITIITVGILCVGAGLFVREAILLLLPQRIWNSWKIVQIIATSYIVHVLKNMYSQLVIIQGRTSRLLWGNMGYLLGSVLVCIAALPRWGENALGWSNIIGLLAAFFILYVSVDKSNYKGMNIIRDLCMLLLAIATLYVSRISHSYPILLSIGLKLVIYLVYVLILTAMYHIYPRQILKALVPGKGRKGDRQC
jgi:O-antigen/teichoic acid export membrane protein